MLRKMFIYVLDSDSSIEWIGSHTTSNGYSNISIDEEYSGYRRKYGHEG
jgi:hypothetical protein